MVKFIEEKKNLRPTDPIFFPSVTLNKEFFSGLTGILCLQCEVGEQFQCSRRETTTRDMAWVYGVPVSQMCAVTLT